MTELRYNPLLQEWVITATHRQERTYKPPPDYCPLCPTKEGEFATEVPEEDYDLVVFENRFPSLAKEPPLPQVKGSKLYPVKEAKGVCEVVLFTSDHHGVMSNKPLSRFIKLVKVWKDRYQELGALEGIEYVFIFENRGEEVGVTLHHPHGQIYAYPFIPPVVARELAASLEYFKKEGRCLICDVVAKEMKGERMILENSSFVAFIPFFARYPYEVHICSKEHKPSLSHLSSKEEEDLAQILKGVVEKYDGLFGFVFPYIMSIHQQPTNGEGSQCSHFHIEFYPPYRTEDKLKHLAGSEVGAGVFINDSLAEEKAKELQGVKPFSL